MIDTEKIEDALIKVIKKEIGDLKTVEPHEKEFDAQTLSSMMPMTPFVLVRYGRLVPVESERSGNGGSGLKRQEFHLTIGSQFLHSRKGSQRGCYSIIRALRERFDGGDIEVEGEPITFALEAVEFLFSVQSLVAYGLILSFEEN